MSSENYLRSCRDVGSRNSVRLHSTFCSAGITRVVCPCHVCWVEGGLLLFLYNCISDLVSKESEVSVQLTKLVLSVLRGVISLFGVCIVSKVRLQCLDTSSRTNLRTSYDDMFWIENHIEINGLGVKWTSYNVGKTCLTR